MQSGRNRLPTLYLITRPRRSSKLWVPVVFELTASMEFTTASSSPAMPALVARVKKLPTKFQLIQRPSEVSKPRVTRADSLIL